MDTQRILECVNQPVGCLASGLRQSFQRVLDTIVDAEDDVLTNAQPVDVRKLFLSRIADSFQRGGNLGLESNKSVIDESNNGLTCCQPVDAL